MKVERFNERFYIVHGDQYFSFFVDYDRASWTKYRESAARYSTEAGARIDIGKLRDRARIRRDQRKAKQN